MRLVICLPTYNERANLEPIVRRLGEVLAGVDAEPRLLVIDDSSPDGTGELADRLAASFRSCPIPAPRSQGGSVRHVAGFVGARAGADRIVQMDADFSRPRRASASGRRERRPLAAPATSRAAAQNWGKGRQAISRFGSFYARTILGVGVRDLTGGFKCWRREVLEALPLTRIRTKGYAFQVETTYRALRAGAEVVEVPIVFAERLSGGSKMTRGIVLEAVWKVPELRARAARDRL